MISVRRLSPFVFSIGTHLALGAVWRELPTAPPPPAQPLMTVTVMEKRPTPTPEPEEKTPETPSPPERSEPKPAAAQRPKAKPPRSERPAAVAPDPPVPGRGAPLKLAGLQLSNLGLGPGGVAVAVGEGGTAKSPSNAKPVESHKSKQSAVKASLTPLSNLSRRPQPPTLNAALRKNYPSKLRRNGVEGSATVRVRLAETGRVLKAQLVSETQNGFGEACRRTLLQSRWSSPLDRQGKAVQTALTYRCRFKVSL